jgi:hypothetical protein
MMNTQTLETIGSFLGRAWSGLGPLLGVGIGAWLTRAWQRKQWELDSKKAEYRELISTLSQNIHAIATTHLDAERNATEEQKRSIMDGYLAGMNSIEDRIFIDKKIRAAKIGELWEQLDLAAGDEAFQRFWGTWNNIHDHLVKMAHDDLGIKD